MSKFRDYLEMSLNEGYKSKTNYRMTRGKPLQFSNKNLIVTILKYTENYTVDIESKSNEINFKDLKELNFKIKPLKLDWGIALYLQDEKEINKLLKFLNLKDRVTKKELDDLPKQ